MKYKINLLNNIEDIFKDYKDKPSEYIKGKFVEKIKEFCRKLGLPEEGCNLNTEIDKLKALLDIIVNVEEKKSLLEDKNRLLCILFNREYCCTIIGRPYEEFCKDVKSSDTLRTEIPKIFNNIHKKIKSLLKELKDEKTKEEIEQKINDIYKGIAGCIGTTQCNIPDIAFDNKKNIYPCIFIGKSYHGRPPPIEKVLDENEKVLKITLNGYVVIEWEYGK